MKILITTLLLSFITIISLSQGTVEDYSKTNDSIASNPKSTSMYDLKRNVLYIEGGGRGIAGSINYEGILPFAQNGGLALSISAGFLLDFVVGGNLVVGRSHNFFEIGTGYSLPVGLLVPQLGYRFQGDKGFLFRVTGMYFLSNGSTFGDFPWAGISFGYSF